MPLNLKIFLQTLYKHFIGTQKVLKSYFASKYTDLFFDSFNVREYTKFRENEISSLFLFNFILIFFIQAGIIILGLVNSYIYEALKKKFGWKNSRLFKFFKYTNQIFKYKFIFSIFTIFLIEEIVFSFYNFAVHMEGNFNYSLSFLSLILSAIYIVGLFFIIVILMAYSNEENYFYKVSKKFFFVTKGIIKHFSQNKYHSFSLIYYYFYSVLMVVAYKRSNIQTILTAIISLLFLIYYMSTLPPE